VRTGRTGKGWSRSLFGVFALLLGADLLLPLKGWISFVLAFAVSVLVLPWIVLTLRFVSGAEAQPEDSGQPARARERSLRGFVLRLALVALTLAFLVAKWAVLVTAQGSDQLYVGASRNYTLGIALLLALGLLGRDLRASRLLASASLHPARLMALSFGGVGLTGALLLSLPVSMQSVASVSLVDNMFTAFSAVCVTGLMTVNLADTYSWFGQLVVLLLVQVGGLGVMVLSAAIAIMAGQRLRLKSSAMLAEVVDGTSLATLKRTVLSICAVTLLMEGLGAGALYLQWQGNEAVVTSHAHHQLPGGGVWWAAMFHAVSAFCNAGISTFSDGLLDWSAEPLTLATVGALVVLGGLGFPVLMELFGQGFQTLRRRRRLMLSLHSRVVLRTSAVLLATTAVVYLVLEWSASLSPLGYLERPVSALFQAVVARSAGFNCVEVGAMLPATWFFTCVVMFIGAGPGSTGGGIKVTTLAALFAGLKAELRSSTPRLLNRTLPDAVVRKAIGIVFLSSSIVLAGYFLLLLLEPHPPLELAFEAVSAFSTTGLSTGLTGRLSIPGKLVIALLMFVGRIGPMTLLLAIAAKSEFKAVRLPEERMLIG
jgi:trk system potassium uptake protein TrkH